MVLEVEIVVGMTDEGRVGPPPPSSPYNMITVPF